MPRRLSFFGLLVLAVNAPPSELRVTLVGNAGVLLTDGVTSLLVDLPYESGAFGYQEYDPDSLHPPGRIVSVITHHHADHFDADSFRDRESWEVIGPPTVIENLPTYLVLRGDSIQVGEFSVVAIQTPHTEDHRSYRIRWKGRVFHFSGDTEDGSSLTGVPVVDILFTTPWLSCAASSARGFEVARRRVAYHLDSGGSDRLCGELEVLPQGSSVTLTSG